MLEVGQKAPEFKMSTDGAGEVSLKGLKGKKVVLYFYPKDDTPGCTKEACGFRDSLPDFSKEKSMYGKKYMGIERATFLIDEKGVIRNIWRKVKVKGHVEEVLEAAQAL